MEKYRAPIGEVIARMKERLGTACFGSADADDARRLIEEYELPAPMSEPERQQTIADVEDEIEILKDYRAFFMSTTCEDATVTRILKSRQAHRAELARGMKA